MFIDLYITMFQEEMSQNTLQLLLFQMDQTLNLTKHQFKQKNVILEKKDAMKKFTDLLQVLLNHFQLKKVQLHQLIMALIQNHTKLYQNKNKTQKNAILEKKDAMKKFTDLLQVLSNHFQLKKVQHLQLTMDLIQSLIKL